MILIIVVGAFWHFAELSAEEPIDYITYLPVIQRPALRGVCGFAHFDKIGADWASSWTWKTRGNPKFVPMIRDIRPQNMDHLAEAVENAKASGWLMGFNEPDLPFPAGWLTTPVEGARAWRIIEGATQGINLVSPAPSQNNFDWLWQMVAEYEQLYGRKPRFDAIAAHYYGTDPQGAKDFLSRVRHEALAHGYDIPIWLTEFAGYCTLPHPQNGNERMMRELIPWMKVQPWIGRYAWFMARICPIESGLPSDYSSCSLTDCETGELTELGELYGGY